MLRMGGMPQEAKARCNSRDRLPVLSLPKDGAGIQEDIGTGRARVLWHTSQGVVKTGEAILRPDWFRYQARASARYRPRARDKGLYPQEPCEVESLMHGFVVAVGWETAPPTTPGALTYCIQFVDDH